MADNYTVNQNTGISATAVMAAKDIGGVLHGKVLPVDGAGNENDVTHPLFVQVMAMVASYLEDSAGASGDRGILILGQRRDADTTSVDTDGDYTVLKMDEAGRLKVAVAPASQPGVTDTITANGDSVVMDVGRVSNVMAHCFGTFSTINCTFEGSLNSTNGTDGNWFTIQAIRTNANTIETTTGNLSAAPAYGWELSVNGLKWLRVRATAFTSGTQTWVFTAAPFATEPIPGGQITGTQPVSFSAQTVTNTPVTPTPSNINSAASTNATSIKASAGTVYSIACSNINAATRYVKFYNKASAPTVGTDVPVLTIAVPTNGTVVVAFGAVGHRFATGIALAITGAAADSDTTAIAANDVKVLTSYV